ncbi:hypothetical protein AAMO2058_000488600 [Amorphochlora amoebiformis]
MDNLREVFEQLDTDGDGIVQFAEILGMLPTEEMKSQLVEIAGGSHRAMGFLEFKEVFSEIMHQNVAEEMEDDYAEDEIYSDSAVLTQADEEEYDTVREVFDKLDSDGDGVLDVEELAVLLPNSKTEEIKETLNQIQTQIPGKITFDEFYDSFDLFCGKGASGSLPPNPTEEEQKPTAAKGSKANPLAFGVEDVDEEAGPAVPLSHTPRHNTTGTMGSEGGMWGMGGGTMRGDTMRMSSFVEEPEITNLAGITPRASLKKDLFQEEEAKATREALLKEAKVAEEEDRKEEEDEKEVWTAEERTRGDSLANFSNLGGGLTAPEDDPDERVSFFQSSLSDNFGAAAAAVLAARPKAKGEGQPEDEEIGALRTKCDAAVEHVKAVERKYKLLARLGAKLEIENSSLEERLTQVLSELNEVNDEKDELRRNMEDLKVKNFSVTEHIRKLREQNYELNNTHLQTIESLELEQRSVKRLREQLDEKEKLLLESQENKAKDMRSDRMAKLAQTRGLMDAMKTKKKLREVEKQLNEEEGKYQASTKRVFSMALELKKKDKIIKALQDRIRTRQEIEGRTLAWDMLRETELTEEGRSVKVEAAGLKETDMSVEGNRGPLKSMTLRPSVSIAASNKVAKIRAARMKKHMTLKSHRRGKTTVRFSMGDNKASYKDRFKTARNMLSRLRDAVDGENLDSPKPAVTTTSMSNLNKATLSVTPRARTGRVKKKRGHVKSVSVMNMDTLAKFYTKDPLDKKALMGALREGASNDGLPKMPKPSMPRKKPKGLTHRSSLTSPSLPSLIESKSSKAKGDESKKTWRWCMEFTTKEAKAMSGKNEIKDCTVAAEELLEILRKKLPKRTPSLTEQGKTIVGRPPLAPKQLAKPKPVVVNPEAKDEKLKKDSTKKLPRLKTHLSSIETENAMVLANYINRILQGDELLVKTNLLPINAETDDLFQKISDGLILAKFINYAQPGTIDIRAMNINHWHDPNLHPWLHTQGGLAATPPVDVKGEKKDTKKVLDMQGMMENLTLVMESSKAIGVQLNDVRANHLLRAHRNPGKVIDFLWSILVARVELEATVKKHQKLVNLLLDSNNGDYKAAIQAAVELGPRDMVKTWVAFHTERALRLVSPEVKKTVKGAGAKVISLEDMEKGITLDWKTCILVLLSIQHNIIKEDMDKDKSENTKRSVARRLSKMEAQWAIDALNSGSCLPVKDKLTEIGAHESALLISTSKVASSDWKRGFAMMGLLMKDRNGMYFGAAAPQNQTLKRASVIRAKAEIMTDDVGDRLERAFRMWINSIGVQGLYIQNLYADCKDGIVLLKVLDKIVPGSVPWKKIELKPNNKFKKLSNCNQLVKIGKSSTFRFSLVNISGEDITGSNKKLTLGLVWQMMRCHVCLFLTTVIDKRFGRGRKSKAKTLRKMLTSGGDTAIIEWANNTVSNSIKKRALPDKPADVDWRKVSRVRSFKEAHLRKGFYFLLLLWAVDDYVVNWDVVTNGETNADCILNARYAISVARKLGATIFLLPEDITELNAKMIMTFVGGILALAS